VLISHGLSGLGGYTASGVRLDLPPNGDERDNTRDDGPFSIKAFSGPDVGVSVGAHFDDILVYRTVEVVAKRANLAARNWPDDILSAITFNRATVGAAIGDSSPPADTGRNTIAFNNATVRGFSNDTTAQNISFVSSGEDGIGLAGGDGLVGGAGGVTEFLRIDFDESARQFALTVDKFEDTGAVHERLELRFIEVVGATATTKATIVKSSCAANGKVTSFSVDACAPFNRVELRTLTTSDSLSQSDLSLNEIRTCIEGVTCETALQPTGNVCSTKVFVPCSIGINDTSQLTVTLANNGSSAMTGVDFSDTYPTLLANAATPAVSTTCTGGVATATGTGLTLVGGTVPANGSCKVQVNVTSAALGTYANSTGNITTASSGTLAPAVGSLIALQRPVVAVDFTPPLVGTTLPSLLTVLFTNSNTQPITKVSVGGPLPAGLTLHLPVTLTTTCGGTFTSSGTTILFTGGTIPAANGVLPSTCKITARVTSTAAGSYSLVLPAGAVTSGNAGANTAAASAALVVN
jgi:uncharacterized repeat protein (TIGR01451 family)